MKKQLHQNAIDVFDENAFIEHLKTLFPTKEKVSAIEGRVAAIEDLNLGDRLCQIGQTGCGSASACGMTGWTDTSTSADQKSYQEKITFSKAFSKTPSVEIAMHAVSMTTSDDASEDKYGWDFDANSITSTGFEFTAYMNDRYFSGIWGIWIACAN